MSNTKTKLAIVDDHALYRNTLIHIFKNETTYKIILDASSGTSFIEKLEYGLIPDIVLLDLSMPEMDGFETIHFIKEKMSWMKVIVLSSSSEGVDILRMKKLGANGYILKNSEAHEILKAVEIVSKQGYFFPQFIDNKEAEDLEVMHAIKSLKEKELVFLKYACSDLSYTDIAKTMHVSRYTIDDYSKSLFKKLKVKSRISLVLLALKYKIIKISRKSTFTWMDDQ